MLFCSYMFNSVAVTENNTMELSRPSDSPAITIIDFSAEKKDKCLPQTDIQERSYEEHRMQVNKF